MTEIDGYWTVLLGERQGPCPNLTYESHAFTYLDWAGNSGYDTDDVALPSGISSGDLLLIFAGKRYDDGSLDAPDGWTLAVSDAGTTNAAAYYRIADGTEGSTVSWTINGDGTVGSTGTNLGYYTAARYSTDKPLGSLSLLGGSPPFTSETGYAASALGNLAANTPPLFFGAQSSDQWIYGGQVSYITGLDFFENGSDDTHSVAALYTERGLDSSPATHFSGPPTEFGLLADVLNRSTVDATAPAIEWDGGSPFVIDYVVLTFVLVCAE